MMHLRILHQKVMLIRHYPTQSIKASLKFSKDVLANSAVPGQIQ